MEATINKKLTRREFAFLAFFLPLFSLKLLNIASSSWLLAVVAAGSFGLFVCYMQQERYTRSQMRFFAVLLVYSAVLIFTCGKQGAFFSIFMILAMKGIDMDRKVYKICFVVGAIVLLLACYQSRNAQETTRYMINGEWEGIVKRSNILYVSFTAVVSLFLLKNRNTLTKIHIIGIAIAGILMFRYVGSRSGLIIMVLLIVMLIAFRSPRTRQSRLIRYACVASPLMCMAFSIFSGVYYGQYEFLNIIDMALQGRIFQNAQYMNHYDISIFGQHIYEGTDKGYFWNLDNAYMDMLICEGLIFAVLWVVITGQVINYMYRKKRMVEVAIIVMYAAYGISETFLPNCFLNVSLFLYGEAFYSLQASKTNKSW